MRLVLLFLLTLFTSLISLGQGRTITGKVVDEYGLEPLPLVTIQDRDTLRLGKREFCHSTADWDRRIAPPFYWHGKHLPKSARQLF